MIQKLFILLLSLLVVDCVGVVSKSFDKYDPESKGNRIRKTVHGPAVVFSAFPVGDSMDSKDAIEELRKVNNCKDLKNLDLEFFHQSFLVVSFQKMVIHADCDKGGKQNSVPTKTVQEEPKPAKEETKEKTEPESKDSTEESEEESSGN